MTTMTKIVLRSQRGWRGGVKKLFKWINSPSQAAFSPPVLTRVGVRGHRVVSQVDFRAGCLCSEAQVDMMGANWFEWNQWWPRCFRQPPVKRQGNAGTVAQEVVNFLVRDFIRILSLFSFSHHLPGRLRRILLLTSLPLMPFSIDHYPPLPSPLLAIAQSETLAALWSLLCGRCSWGGEEASIEDVWLFTLIWSMGSMCSSELLANWSPQ